MDKCRLLLFGATGMLGFSLYRYFSNKFDYEVSVAIRNIEDITQFKNINSKNIHIFNINQKSSIFDIFSSVYPDIVINCVGVIKQIDFTNRYDEVLIVNSIFPKLLEKISCDYNFRLIHFSTDCVFSGSRGMYKESDFSDATDLYGLSKFLGEVSGQKSLTLRTSIIGHEYKTTHSLLSWFLSQKDTVSGYCNAVFSGLPTIEIAKILDKLIIPNKNLVGLYHLSADPINKYELLKLIAKIYKVNINIISADTPNINRSLNSDRFRLATGFLPRPWEDMIINMKMFG